jgi:hypothetical protein
MHDAKSALHAYLGRKTFATFAGDLEKTSRLDRMIDLPYGLRVEGFFVNDDAFAPPKIWSGSRDLHPNRRVHNAKCCYYTTILI